MSENENIVVVSNTQALQTGGVGVGVGLFKARPSFMELVQKTSRQESVKYGEFRDISTNEHFGNVIRVVLLAVPQPQMEKFVGSDFKADSKKCFSLDTIQPHPRAAEPPAAYCRFCPDSMLVDKNWETWRKTKDPKDLPACKAFWHLLVALRTTQRPYYLNIKGTSFKPFRMAMETQMQGMLANMLANAKAENKKRGYSLVTLQDTKTGAQWQEFRPTPGFTHTGEAQLPEPMPNLFEISFDIVATSKDGGPYVMSFTKFAVMNAADRAEFGQLYLELLRSKQEDAQQYTEAVEADAEVLEAPATQATNEPQIVI